MAETPIASLASVAPETRDPKDVEENKDLAALSYAWIMSVVLLFLKKHSPFVHFHAKQGTVLFILSLLFWKIPYANRILELLVFFLMVWGFLASAQGRWTELPFVGHLARGKCTFRGSWKQTVAAVVHAKNWLVDLWTHHDQGGNPNSQGPRATTSSVSSQQPATSNSQSAFPTPNTQHPTPSVTFPLQPSSPSLSLTHQDIPPVDSGKRF